MRTRARRDVDSWVLSGTKLWITNGGLADIAIVWARTDDGIRGFIVPTELPGFTSNCIQNKLSLRASVTSELVLDDCQQFEEELARAESTADLPEERRLVDAVKEGYLTYRASLGRRPEAGAESSGGGSRSAARESKQRTSARARSRREGAAFFRS